ncbi:unnamed protein product [Pelagomonas calceolata]|uniref:WW domain-containing protein n=1 Tax=Pelagomonas calceolata TaxID=35677 RepID=A0A8J2SDX8_9STRA|nr:unnamed protein product [Pelagomonas calceolata]
MSYQVQVPNYDTTTGAPLPAGWVRWVDPESDEFYYHNETTGETTWDDPTRWKVGLLFDRLRGEPPKDAPLYRPRTIECAFAEYSSADTDESDGDAPVTLRVYDVSFRGAGALNSLLNGSSGAFHTAIEVHGLEWSFGATADDDDDTSGIFCCDPASAQPHRYREAISLGRTKKSPVDVFNILLRLAPFWLGKSYDVLRKNCNSFCILFSGELGADAPPPWTHRLGDGAAALDDRVSRLLETTGLGGGDEPRADGPAAVVWDHPQWCARHFDSLAEAERLWAALPLAHAACFFVRDAPSLTIDGADAPAVEWTLHKSYGLPHATARIRDRFASTRALRRRAPPPVRPAANLLRPPRRPLGASESKEVEL